MAEKQESSSKPKAQRHVQRARKAVGAARSEILVQPVSGFVLFLREHAIVGLAIGIVIGSQVQGMVKQITDSFINPLFQLLFSGNKALSSRTFTLHFASRHANFAWGAVAYSMLDFLFVLAVLYALIKLLNLDKIDIKKKS